MLSDLCACFILPVDFLLINESYHTLRPLLNGETVQLGSLQRKLLKQPLVVHSHRKWNHQDGSAPLARLRIRNGELD